MPSGGRMKKLRASRVNKKNEFRTLHPSLRRSWHHVAFLSGWPSARWWTVASSTTISTTSGRPKWVRQRFFCPWMSRKTRWCRQPCLLWKRSCVRRTFFVGFVRRSSPFCVTPVRGNHISTFFENFPQLTDVNQQQLTQLVTCEVAFREQPPADDQHEHQKLFNQSHPSLGVDLNVR